MPLTKVKCKKTRDVINEKTQAEMKTSRVPVWVQARGLQCFKLNGNHTEKD